MAATRTKSRIRVLLCEGLERRCVLATVTGLDAATIDEGANDFHAVIVAGDPNGSPADSPTNRVDVNASDSPFAGVGSLRINARRGTYICTATPIDTTHVLTAGHCVDLNNDGKSNSKDGINSLYFQLNTDVDTPTDQVDTSIRASSWVVNPNFTGFNHPSINDDLAIITLGTSLPAGTPTYSLTSSDMTAGSTHLIMVGYGQSGDGVNGYTVNASFTVKRHGENIVDAFYTQDDAGQPAANEVFRYDFDGPSGNGSLGGPTLGNDLETTLGGGDSGGPSFVLIDAAHPELSSSYQLVGVNTFTQGSNTPKFGSLGGGINLYPYLSWISGAQGAIATDGGSSGGGRGTAASSDSVLGIAMASEVASEGDLEPTADVSARTQSTELAQINQLPLSNQQATLFSSAFCMTSGSSFTRSLTTGRDTSATAHDSYFAELDSALDAPALL